MTSPLDIEALKAVAEKATPGPWFNAVVERPMRVGDSYDSNGWTTEFVGYEILGQDDAIVHSATDGFQREEDAEFSARFDPPTALSLIARTEAAEGEVQRLKGLQDEHDLFDAETDIAFKDLDAEIANLKADNEKLRLIVGLAKLQVRLLAALSEERWPSADDMAAVEAVLSIRTALALSATTPEQSA